MSWRLARALSVLQTQVNTAHPNRPRQADGTIGDTAHQAQGAASDHNPNGAGVVTAWDITTADFTDALADQLRRAGLAGDRRVKYVIYKHAITSAVHAWQWAPYSGADPHTSHIHLSVSADPAEYDRTDAWQLAGAAPHPEDDMTPQDKQEIIAGVLAGVDDRVRLLLRGDAGQPGGGAHPDNLAAIRTDTTAIRKQLGA